MPARAAAARTGTHLPSPLQVSGVGTSGIHSFSGAGELGQGLAPRGRPAGPQTLNRAALPLADLRLSASLSRDAATRRGRISTCSRGWGRRGQPRVPPGLHLCHLGLPVDRPSLRVPWSPATGAPPRGAVCRLHSAASSLFPSLSGPERDTK